jgi:hypothetical protein
MLLIRPRLVLSVSLATACSAAPEPTVQPTGGAASAPVATDAPPVADRPELTTEACEAKGGKVVGDIGDGAVHRPDYKCESGLAPIGRVALGVEGSVCCTGAGAAPTPAASTSRAPGKPASTSKIGGQSLSTLDVATLKAALEKAGYGVVGPEDIVPCGDSETLQLSLTKKGKPVGLFSLQRPTAKPDDCKGTPAKEAYEKWKPSAEGPKAKNAVTFDEPASVLLALNLLKDEPGAAKKLLDALVTK